MVWILAAMLADISPKFTDPHCETLEYIGMLATHLVNARCNAWMCERAASPEASP